MGKLIASNLYENHIGVHVDTLCGIISAYKPDTDAYIGRLINELLENIEDLPRELLVEISYYRTEADAELYRRDKESKLEEAKDIIRELRQLHVKYNLEEMGDIDDLIEILVNKIKALAK